jgi:predicted ATP-grasp superfamily ATP-dependent carboligase
MPMEKLLIAGVNTRPLANSAYHLGYEIYSANYFCTTDFNSYHHKRCILEQKPHYSCGYFQESYHPSELEELCSDWVDEVDHIITYTGVSPDNFPSTKILGNKRVNAIENKYKLYKRLKNRFRLPKTFLLSDIQEAHEIESHYPEKEFLIKPVKGSGGYGIYKLRDLPKSLSEFNNNEFLMQEFIKGENVSASVLSTGKKTRSILTSKQISGGKCPGLKDGFIYCGNLSPYPGYDSLIHRIAEEVIVELSLLGSNGVDMIVSDGKVYIIEVNPRLQGTFECAESSLGINMIDAHIKACQGELIATTSPQRFTAKKIVYTTEKCKVGKIDLHGVFDIPLENTIIEKGEPVVTVIGSGKTPEEAVNKAEDNIKNIRKKLIHII